MDKGSESCMDIMTILSGPLIGAVIGYITNDLAIRMLFRPRKAVYLFGHRLPFTPGIVPRRKDQLAKILGDAIVEKFFNADDLEIVFTDGIGDAVADAIVKALRSDMKPSDAAAVISHELRNQLERELCIRIQTAICMSDLPETLAFEGQQIALRQIGDGAGQAIASGILDRHSEAISRDIREFLIEQAYPYIFPLVHQEVEALGSQSISGITSQLFGEDDQRLHEAAKQLYLRFMSHHVRPIVESIDVGGMITEKIILMTSAEVEDLVLSVVRRELRLVVLFGAFVGALIGAVNIIL